MSKSKISACIRWNKPVDDKERFWSYVNVQGFFDCWEWIGGINGKGYGQFRKDNIKYTTHRFSYTLYYGNIPNGLFVCHKCNNRKCVNPFHLYAGTAKDNSDDITKANRRIIKQGETNGMSKLTEQQVLEIRKNLNKLSQRKLGKIYNVSHNTIGSIQHKTIWRHL